MILRERRHVVCRGGKRNLNRITKLSVELIQVMDFIEQGLEENWELKEILIL